MPTVTTPLDTDTVFVWSDTGRETLVRMAYHVAAVSSAYGPEHKWSIEIAASFAKAISSLHGFQHLRIMKDGDLSLFCNTTTPQQQAEGRTGLVFGIIFHAHRRYCTKDGCKALLSDEGVIWTYSANDPRCDDHTWAYPLGLPVPGTWSFHS